MIDTILIEKIARFEEITGEKPSAIYLGRAEVLDLKEWVGFAHSQTFEMSHGPEFYGYKVYEVNATNHIGIG